MRDRRDRTSVSAEAHGGVGSTLLLSALLLAAGIARPLSAMQNPPDATVDSLASPRIGCIQGDPLPRCATSWILEMQASTTLVEPTWTEPTPSGGTARATADEKLVEWTVGHLWNASPAWGFGGTVSMGNNAQGGVTGLRVRARRWLSPALSLSLEAGLARSTARPTVFRTGSGPSVGLRFDAEDAMSVFLRYDRIEGVGYERDDPRYATSTPHEYLRLGVGLGGKPALVGTGIVAVAAAVVSVIIGYSLAGAT